MVTGSVDGAWRIPEPVRAQAPAAAQLLDEANAWAWRGFPPALLEQLRLRIAALLGNEKGRQRRANALGLTEAKLAQLGHYYESDAFSQRERDCLEFAEQFAIDVSGPIADYVDRLRPHFPGDRLKGFVVAAYLTEFTQRLEMIAGALLGGHAGAAEQSPATATAGGGAKEPLRDMARALAEYQDAVVRLGALDPVLTELVRLRCARVHNCRICKTLRLADARAAGADDAMTAKVDHYERSDLDERAKTALRVTDAMISGPGTLGASVVAQAKATFSPAELAELCLDITKWSTQKIHVSLGTDSADRLPRNADSVSYFSFDEDGRVAGYSATPTNP